MKTFLKGPWDGIALASLVLLVFAVAFGGASQGHALRLALIELVALPVLVLAGGRLIQTGLWREHRFALTLTAGLVTIPLLQLIPLPREIWSSLPGRDQMVTALQLVGLQPGWAPLSVAPERTWNSVLALIPPIAFFIAMLSLSIAQRERIVQLTIALALIGIFLGTAQLASGSDNLYLWNWTGAGSVTGFFANRNHLASNILVVLPFAITFGAATLRRRDQKSSTLWFSALFVGLSIMALAAIRSRAGISLFVPVMLLSLLAAWIAAGRGRPGQALLLLFGSAGAAITAVAILALPPILARFDAGATSESRFERWPLVADTAQTYLPFGSGIGTFDSVYRSVETVAELDSTFFNQAHNEYLESWLETGWLGAGLLVAFLIWYGSRCWTAWRAIRSQERDLQRAASIGVGVLLLHSIVDYPLRTITLAVLFAMCCGLLELAKRPDKSFRS